MVNSPGYIDTKTKRRNEEDALARDIIDECRMQLMFRFRFLDLALWRMPLHSLRVGLRYPLATNAKEVYYEPNRVISRFQDSFDEAIRDYLHLVTHCIFRHPFDESHSNIDAWDIACDIITESAAMDMCGERFSSALDVDRRQAISEIRMVVGSLLPRKVYNLINDIMQLPEGAQFRGLGHNKLNDWRYLFERDDHGGWPARNKGEGEEQPDPFDSFEVSDDPSDASERIPQIGDMTEESSLDKDEYDEGPDESKDDDEDESFGGDYLEDDEGSDEASIDSDNEQGIFHMTEESAREEEKEWEDIAKQIEVDLKTFSKEWGDEAASFMANLSVVNRTKYLYTEFLKKFMSFSEEILLNMDEFDYLFYTYGLELYGNMPLIEPLEYKESERIRDFAIVIDTSESVSGDLVKKFIDHTFSILKSSEEYATRVNIHLVQCDAKVQSDIRITNLQEVDEIMDNFTICGFGGTDFRPAFSYIDTLREYGDLENMKGLIYFTDGLGQFPEKVPDYETAFVFIGEEGEQTPPVPPWACKILIDETDIDSFIVKN